MRIFTVPGLLALLLPALSMTSYAGNKKYTIEDLKALAGTSSWNELLQHLGDVPPAQRKADWEKLAQQAGSGALENAANTEDPLSGIQVSETLIDQYPQLKKARPFMEKRSAIGLKAFEHCLDMSYYADQCGKLLKTFVAHDPENLDLAFKAGKLARLKMRHWYAATFFKTALTKKGGERNCGDEDVKLSVLSALDLPSDNKSYAETITAAQTILKDQCFAELKEAVLDEFRKDSSYFVKNACPPLKAKNALGKVSAKKCS